MNINEILRSGANVQLVINALDLKEAFLQWNAEQKEESFPILQEEYKTPNETAKMLDVDKSTLWRWAKQGYLVPVKWGTNLGTNCQTLDVAWRAKIWKKRKKATKAAPTPPQMYTILMTCAKFLNNIFRLGSLFISL